MPDDPADKLARVAAETHIDSHMLLEAGAGSGKTTVLVSRYRHILDDAGASDDSAAAMDRVAAITFTKKAAREMKERLRDVYAKRLAACVDSAKRRRLRDLLRALETAPISTIHSLCESLLKQYPFAAGVDPQFGVIDDRQRSVQLPRTVADSLLRGLEEGRASAALVVGQFESLSAAVEAIVGLIDKRELYTRWLDTPPAAEDLLSQWADLEAEWASGFPKELRAMPEYEELLAALNDMAPTAEAQPADKLSAFVRDLLAKLALEPPDDPEGIAEWATTACGTGKAGSVGSAKVWGDDIKERRQRLSAAIDGFRKQAGKLAEVAGTPSPGTADLAAALWAETREALTAWQRHKDLLPALDFDDLQQGAKVLLEDAKVRAEVQHRFRHLLVDEFQDTNDLQRRILWRLAGIDEAGDSAAKVFVVGDAKQSIYRFRNADVAVYTQTRKNFEARQGQGYEVERLSVSFRPNKGLMAFINRLFQREQMMGVLAHYDFQAAYEAMSDVRAETPVEPCALGILTAGRLDDDILHRRLGEARTIAVFIKQRLLGDERPEIYDHRTRSRRALREGDIAILFRATHDIFLYEDALAGQGLRFYNASGRGFFTRPEVQDMVNALRAVGNPEDAIAVVGALRSPMFATSDVALFWLAQVDAGWWDRLMATGEEGAWSAEPLSHIPVEERAGLTRAAGLLAAWREARDRVPISVLMETILDETGYSAAMAAQPDGLRSVANLGKLLDLARDYEASATGGLSGFVEMMRELAERDEAEAQAPTEEEEGEGIRLSTIHGAKGLQWPVVIVADLGRQANAGFEAPLLRMHPEYGIVPAEVEQYRPRKWRLAGEMIRRRSELEEAAEEQRLLYVALTRASDLLVMSSWLDVAREKGGEALVVKMPRGATWLTMLLDACGCLGEVDGLAVPEEPAALDAELGAWYVTSSESPPEIEVAMRAAETEGGEPAADAGDEDGGGFEMALARVAPDPSARERFSVSELADYRFCPRGYWLRHVEGLPEGRARAADPERKLSAVERGTMAHQVLQMVGTGGAGELDQVLRGGRPLPGGRDLRVVSEDEAARIRRLVEWYLESEFYGTRVAAPRQARDVVGRTLRTEAWISFEVNGALVEGKMDAVAEGEAGAVLIDYKTGRAPSEPLEDEGEPARDVFQISLYSLGLREVTGKWPAEGAVVYLADRKIEAMRPEADARVAEKQAAEAIAAIRRGGLFGKTAEGEKCEQCRMRWACRDEG